MTSSLMPALRYADAPAAIDFLCRAFGFEQRVVHADADDPKIIHHAQLSLAGGLIMISSAVPGAVADRYGWKTPDEAGGITASIYIVVVDADAHHARAIAAGATIIDPPHDNVGYPGRSYNAKDPEGYDWDFGTYDPWIDQI